MEARAGGQTRTATGPGSNWPVIVVALLTVAAFAARAGALGQNLFGDELFTFDDVHGRDLPGMVTQVREGIEDNPPLFFILAWAADKVGDAYYWIRVPSLIFGAGLVPVTYALGARLLDRRAGLLGAALVAFSPFALFYGSEARAYAMLGFFSALSLLLLVRAVGTRSRMRWLVYALCVCTLLYTHYTAAGVLLAHVVWVAWRQRPDLPRLVLADLAALAGYAPWLVTELTKEPRFAAIVPDLSPRYGAESFARVLPAHPFRPLGEVPGHAPLLVFAAVGLALLALLAYRRWSHGTDGDPALPGALSLLVLTSVATPLLLLAFSLGGHNIFLPRNMTASMPAAVLLLSWAVVTVPRTAVAPAAVLAAVVCVGAVQTLGDEEPRGGGAREAAQFVDDRAAPGDEVVQRAPGFGGARSALAAALSPYFEEPHRTSVLGVDDSRAWRRAAAGARVFVVQTPVFGGSPELEARSGPGRCYRLTAARRPSSSFAVGVYELPRRLRPCATIALHPEAAARLRVRLEHHNGKTVIPGWFDGDLPVVGPPRGFLEAVAAGPRRLSLSGWAADPERERVAAWVLVTVGGRLLAAVPPEMVRRDLFEAYGPALAKSGFSVSFPRPSAGPADSLRLFAVLDGEAHPLSTTAPARASIHRLGFR